MHNLKKKVNNFMQIMSMISLNCKNLKTGQWLLEILHNL
jgi:hypothetical protein